MEVGGGGWKTEWAGELKYQTIKTSFKQKKGNYESLGLKDLLDIVYAYAQAATKNLKIIFFQEFFSRVWYSWKLTNIWFYIYI